jgi:hypothetical protein
MTRVVDMIDAIGADSSVIPDHTQRVAAYLTGSGGIAWTGPQVAQLRSKGVHTVIRIDQASNLNLFRGYPYVVCDIEPGAKSAPTAAREAAERAKIGARTGFYFSAGDIAAVAAACRAEGLSPFPDAWEADWNLSRDEAIAQLGKIVDGFPIVAIQWASPTSNPSTIMPGSRLTLAQANADLSVTLADWPAPLPSRPHKHHLPHPKKPHRKTVGATAGAALGVAITAVLHAAGVHITPAEAAAISTLTAAISGTITPAHA